MSNDNLAGAGLLLFFFALYVGAWIWERFKK